MNDVRDEAVAQMLDGAAGATEPIRADRFDEIIRRGNRRRTVLFTAIGTAIAVFVGSLAWFGLTFPRGRVAIPADVTDWRTFASLDENGWTIQVPPPWYIQELPSCENAPERIGVIVTNVDFEFRNPRGDAPGCEDRFVFAGFPRDGVALAVMPVGFRTGLFRRTPADTLFPLTPDRLTETNGIRGGPSESYESIYQHEQLLVIVRRWVGPDATTDDVSALDRMLATFQVREPTRWTETEDTQTTLHDERLGYRVTYPSDWIVADENLTPWLSSPAEILSLGTFPLRVSNDPEDGLRLFDAPVAPKALADMTSTDAFISVQGGGDALGDTRSRPDHFGPLGCKDTMIGCDPANWEKIPFRAWWIPFKDAGRAFYLFVAIGNDSTPELRDQTWATADSLVFEPTEP